MHYSASELVCPAYTIWSSVKSQVMVDMHAKTNLSFFHQGKGSGEFMGVVFRMYLLFGIPVCFASAL